MGQLHIDASNSNMCCLCQGWLQVDTAQDGLKVDLSSSSPRPTTATQKRNAERTFHSFAPPRYTGMAVFGRGLAAPRYPLYKRAAGLDPYAVARRPILSHAPVVSTAGKTCTNACASVFLCTRARTQDAPSGVTSVHARPPASSACGGALPGAVKVGAQWVHNRC
eukprot:366199-Chlamydomonas_euryale.AAC.8